jgi:hypothetical protein
MHLVPQELALLMALMHLVPQELALLMALMHLVPQELALLAHPAAAAAAFASSRVEAKEVTSAELQVWLPSEVSSP